MPRSAAIIDYDFTQADGAPVNFTQIDAGLAGPIQVISGVFFGTFGIDVPTGPAAAVWSGAGSLNADQWVRVLPIFSNVGVNHNVAILARTGTDINAARDFFGVALVGNHATTPTIILFSVINGAYTQYHSGAVAWASGVNWLELEVTGASPNITLTAYKDGVAIPGFSVTGITGPDTGTLGVQAGDDPFVGGTQVQGGNITAGGASASLAGDLVGALAFTGVASSAPASTFAGAINALAFSGFAGVPPGRLVSPPICTDADSNYINQTGVTLIVVNMAGDTVVCKLTNQTTDAAGVLTSSYNAGMQVGTEYRFIGTLASGEEFYGRKVAEA